MPKIVQVIDFKFFQAQKSPIMWRIFVVDSERGRIFNSFICLFALKRWRISSVDRNGIQPKWSKLNLRQLFIALTISMERLPGFIFKNFKPINVCRNRLTGWSIRSMRNVNSSRLVQYLAMKLLKQLKCFAKSELIGITLYASIAPNSFNEIDLMQSPKFRNKLPTIVGQEPAGKITSFTANFESDTVCLVFNVDIWHSLDCNVLKSSTNLCDSTQIANVEILKNFQETVIIQNVQNVQWRIWTRRFVTIQQQLLD